MQDTRLNMGFIGLGIMGTPMAGHPLALMGRHITHVGAVGDGQTAKVANQIIVALTIAAVAEAMLRALEVQANFELGPPA